MSKHDNSAYSDKILELTKQIINNSYNSNNPADTGNKRVNRDVGSNVSKKVVDNNYSIPGPTYTSNVSKTTSGSTKEYSSSSHVNGQLVDQKYYTESTGTIPSRFNNDFNSSFKLNNNGAQIFNSGFKLGNNEPQSLNNFKIVPHQWGQSLSGPTTTTHTSSESSGKISTFNSSNFVNGELVHQEHKVECSGNCGYFGDHDHQGHH